MRSGKYLAACALLVADLWAARAGADRGADLAAAGRLLQAGEYQRASDLVAKVSADPRLLPAERAEAHRIHGLALFFLDRRAEAEGELRAYLVLEPDAHLDPALYPPEAVVFLEDIRTRHAGELRIARPPPRKRRYAWLNLLPPAGQIQNGDAGKAWIIGGAEVALAAVNITTYVMLTSSCGADLTCDRDPSSARALRVTNLVSGGLLIGVWVYGVIDGYAGHRRATAREAGWRMALSPHASGALVGAATSF